MNFRGASIDAKDNHGRTPLLVAAEEGHSEVIKLLKSKGANIYTTDRSDRSALFLAAANNHVKLCEVGFGLERFIGYNVYSRLQHFPLSEKIELLIMNSVIEAWLLRELKLLSQADLQKN